MNISCSGIWLFGCFEVFLQRGSVRLSSAGYRPTRTSFLAKTGINNLENLIYYKFNVKLL